MSQTGFTPIITYNTATASAAPTAGNLTQGELAVNVTDKKLYTKDSGGAVVQVGSGPSATETLTNKTLTTPVINGFSGTGNATITGTLGVSGQVSGDTYLFGTGYGQLTWDTGKAIIQGLTGKSVVIRTNGTSSDAVTIDASGNLLVGTTSVFNVCKVGIKADSSAFNILSIGNTGASNGAFIGFLNSSDVTVGSVTQSGSSVVFTPTSDHRLKTNVRDANAARFMDVKFRDFEWIDGRHDCGVIAHELAEVYPDLVLGEKDATEIRTVEITPAIPAVTEQRLVFEPEFDKNGDQTEAAVYETVEITPAVDAVTEEQTFPVYQQVNYMGLIGRMGARIQQLQRTVDALEARLTALEAK